MIVSVVLFIFGVLCFIYGMAVLDLIFTKDNK